MKELITKVTFRKELETKYGKSYSFEICYAGKKAAYYSKTNPCDYFEEGKEFEFTEEQKSYVSGGKTTNYTVVSKPKKQRQSNFGKALTKEQARYSGFAVSYAKDLCIAKVITREEFSDYSWFLFELMVEMDKSLEQ